MTPSAMMVPTLHVVECCDSRRYDPFIEATHIPNETVVGSIQRHALA